MTERQILKNTGRHFAGPVPSSFMGAHASVARGLEIRYVLHGPKLKGLLWDPPGTCTNHAQRI